MGKASRARTAERQQRTYTPPAGERRREDPAVVVLAHLARCAAAVDALGEVRRLDQVLNAARAQYVAAARSEGSTWSQIGSALGVSHQAVAHRYGAALRLIT